MILCAGVNTPAHLLSTLTIMSFFVAEHITKNYASHRALDDVSIEIPEGAIYGLLGPNGAGKTSLIRIITQITGPDSGQLFFKGKPPVSYTHLTLPTKRS